MAERIVEELRPKVQSEIQKRYPNLGPPIGWQETVSAYEDALQSYLSDKIIIPLEMIGEARGFIEDVFGNDVHCFLQYNESCEPLVPYPDCRLCKLLTEASQGDKP